MGDLLDGYVAAAAFDEMFDGTAPRDHYRQLHTALQTLSRSDFDQRCDARDQAFRDQGITVSEVLGQRRGVCQDFVHLNLGLLRAQGIPARYASGYLYPLEDGEIGEAVVGESHAWLEAWLGSWLAVDPTNGTRSASRSSSPGSRDALYGRIRGAGSTAQRLRFSPYDAGCGTTFRMLSVTAPLEVVT